MVLFQPPRTCQKLAAVTGTGAGFFALTAMSRVMVRHSAGPSFSASVACQVPAAGAAISASQKYGEPPCRSDDFAATLPSGAVSENTPVSGFSVTTMTRSGAPFQGASGEGRTVNSAVSLQMPAGAWACDSIVERSKEKPAISNHADAATVNRHARRIGVDPAERPRTAFPRGRMRGYE